MKVVIRYINKRYLNPFPHGAAAAVKGHFLNYYVPWLQLSEIGDERRLNVTSLNDNDYLTMDLVSNEVTMLVV